MKKTALKILAVALVLATLVTCLVACGKKDNSSPEAAKATSYVTMDINPSVELVLDQNDKVMSVYAANEDAAVMFYGENSLIGLSVEVASKKIVELAIENGYVNVEVNAVNVTVSTTVDGKADSVFVKVDGAINNVEVEVNNETVTVSVQRNGDFITEIELDKLKEANPEYADLTVEQYKLIKAAMVFDANLTLDVAVTMTDAELIAIVEDGHAYFKGKFDKECAKAIAAAERVYEVAEQSYLSSAYLSVYAARILEGKFGRNYGLEYLIYTTLYNSTNAAIQTIDEYLAEPTVSSADLARISTELGLEAAEVEALLEDENGVITRASINAYLNKEYKKCVSEEQQAAIKAHYDALDEILTDIETAAQNVVNDNAVSVSVDINACGASIQTAASIVLPTNYANIIAEVANKFADIRDIRDAEGVLQYLAEQIEATKAAMDNDLTAAEKDTVNDIMATRKANCESIRNSANNAVKAACEQAKLRLQQLKDSKFVVDVTIE